MSSIQLGVIGPRVTVSVFAQGHTELFELQPDQARELAELLLSAACKAAEAEGAAA